MSEPNYEIRQIDPTDRVNKLNLLREDGALSAYLQRSSLHCHTNNVAKTYVCVDANDSQPRKRVWAYISILVSEVRNEDAHLEELPNFYFPYPSVKIARLGVDIKLQRSEHKLGRKLVGLAIAIAKRQLMPHVGCRFVMVDANKPAIEFYKKCGFTLVDTKANLDRDSPVMFYDLQRVE